MCFALAASGKTRHRFDSLMQGFEAMAVESPAVEGKGGNPYIGVVREMRARIILD